MSLEKEIADSIKKNLPQQVGDVLKEKLDQADVDAKKVISYKEKIESDARIILELEKKIANYKLVEEQIYSLDSREKELEKNNAKLDLEILKYQLQAEKEKTEFTKNIAMGLVRNIEYRKIESSGQPVKDLNGNVYYPTPTNSTHSAI